MIFIIHLILKYMAAYQIQINERIVLGRSILALLQSVPDAVSFNKTATPKHSKHYYELKEAFQDVKEMMDGKKPKRTLDELINELRNSEV
ncbi:hypothetical protein AGMMS4956_12640 [Bacteroidia bacterium]|nr:hypothetical protein AGMMS4956_12640 [Bacteroidia bacterium]